MTLPASQTPPLSPLRAPSGASASAGVSPSASPSAGMPEIPTLAADDPGFDWGELFELLDLGFSTQGYTENFPHVFARGTLRDVCLVRVQGRLAACATLYPLTWCVQGDRREGQSSGRSASGSASPVEAQTLRAYCVGSVCTHPEFRGRGLARAVLDFARAQALARQADFIFLFSELGDFYAKAGYRPAGLEHFVPLPKKASAAAVTLGVSGTASTATADSTTSAKAEPKTNAYMLASMASTLEATGYAKSRQFCYFKDAEALASGFCLARLWRFVNTQADPANSVLGYREFFWLASIPHMECCLVLKEGQPVAVAFIGKGSDFQEVIHGLAYVDTKDLVWLVAKLREAFPKRDFLLMTGPNYKDFGVRFAMTTAPSLLCQTLKPLTLPQVLLEKMFSKNRLYVRSLHSS